MRERSRAKVERLVRLPRGRYTFHFAEAPGAWKRIGGEQDGTVLSTAVAGGFVGAYLGMYARLEP